MLGLHFAATTAPHSLQIRPRPKKTTLCLRCPRQHPNPGAADCLPVHWRKHPHPRDGAAKWLRPRSDQRRMHSTMACMHHSHRWRPQSTAGEVGQRTPAHSNTPAPAPPDTPSLCRLRRRPGSWLSPPQPLQTLLGPAPRSRHRVEELVVSAQEHERWWKTPWMQQCTVGVPPVPTRWRRRNPGELRPLPNCQRRPQPPQEVAHRRLCHLDPLSAVAA
mmetsp:Transcript_39492/g.86103  ORF Transcript_39492/g.86103 Transcript_39492/m.86103 type:complete len:218 (-) Transcript_39492:1138-1791(-)